MNNKLRSFAYLTSLIFLMLSAVFTECVAERGFSEALTSLPAYLVLGVVLTAIAGFLVHCDIIPSWARQTQQPFTQSIGK